MEKKKLPIRDVRILTEYYMCVKKYWYSQMCMLANVVACLKQTSTSADIILWSDCICLLL